MIAKPKRGQAEWFQNVIQQWALRIMILPERKGWTLYQRVSELLLSFKEGWRRIKWSLYPKVQSPEKWASSWEEGLSSLPEGEWALLCPKEGWRREWEEWLQDEGNRKRKYKYIIWCNLIYEKDFSFSSIDL